MPVTQPTLNCSGYEGFTAKLTAELSKVLSVSPRAQERSLSGFPPRGCKKRIGYAAPATVAMDLPG